MIYIYTYMRFKGAFHAFHIGHHDRSVSHKKRTYSICVQPSKNGSILKGKNVPYTIFRVDLLSKVGRNNLDSIASLLSILVNACPAEPEYGLPLQTVQIQISWLLKKPTDLDLHCLSFSI